MKKYIVPGSKHEALGMGDTKLIIEDINNTKSSSSGTDEQFLKLINGTLENLVIPGEVGGIRAYAFGSDISTAETAHPAACTFLKTVKILNGVSTIGSHAFNYCTGLERVEMESSVSQIGDYAFGYCSNLTDINFSPNITIIEDCLFYECTKLENIELPANLVTIKNGVFYGCSAITSLEIPASVTSIGQYSFFHNYQLSSLKFKGSTPPSATGAFVDIPTTCTIYVPRGSLTAYTSAAGYPSSSSYSYVEYDL